MKLIYDSIFLEITHKELLFKKKKYITPQIFTNYKIMCG